jgi:hypothetical protein
VSGDVIGRDDPSWVKDCCAATAPVSEDGRYINFMASDDQAGFVIGGWSRRVGIRRRAHTHPNAS